MDILRLTIAPLIIISLLIGCDNKAASNTPTDVPKEQTTALLTPQVKQGDSKEYWIQSYSTVSNNKIDWSNKNQRVGTKALVNYQIKEINNDQLTLLVTAKHIELLVRDNAAYLHPTLQSILSKGINYQLNFYSNTPLTISEQDTKTQQQLANSVDLRTEYKYLQAALTSPLLPASLPLVKGQQIVLTNFMQMDKVTITVTEITNNKVTITLAANNDKAHLYGKAVLQKHTGWLEKMALVQEAPLTDRTDYTMRTVLLIGPASWSANNNRQLADEMQIKDTEPYLNPFPVFDFDVSQWHKLQQQEQNAPVNSGKLYTLTNLDGSTQLILVIPNNVEAIPQLLGHYQLTSLALFDKDQNIIPNSLLLPTASSVYKIKTATNTETNIASFKLKITNPPAPNQLADIAKIMANVSFTPYQIEKITLPLAPSSQTGYSQNNDFRADISPTDQAKIYVLHWRAKDGVIFNPQLMKGADNALIQFIQPDTETWLTPAETRIVNSVSNGFENRIKIAFTATVPKQLDLYIIKRDRKATAINHSMTFSRD